MHSGFSPIQWYLFSSSENCLVPVLCFLAAANFLSYACYRLVFLQLFLPLPSFCGDFYCPALTHI